MIENGEARAALEMAAAIAGDRQALRKRTVISLMQCTAPPLGQDGGSVDAALLAAEAGIPVVTLDAEVYGSKRDTFLGTGNVNAGKAGGKILADLVGGKGKVALITKVGQSNLEERIAGYKAVFAAEYPEIELVQIIDDQSDSAKAIW